MRGFRCSAALQGLKKEEGGKGETLLTCAIWGGPSRCYA